MPRIRILQSVAGLDFSWAPGDVVEVDAAVAEAWADGERAELADDDGKENAGAEKAAARSRGGGRSRRAETRAE
ncbi:hypothetical protein [Streptomyces luteocolor]|uniref:hypothetical protein n=1 Tax=Streptomyces luteocolor TaxID=285500 RepID=UPI000853A2E9|nr:hypothetical protein [Streptomyces luteocolor]